MISIRVKRPTTFVIRLVASNGRRGFGGVHYSESYKKPTTLLFRSLHTSSVKRASDTLSFIERVETGLPIRSALEPSLEDEHVLRRLFATDVQNPRLNDPHVGLVDLFAGPESLRLAQAREVDQQTKDAQYIFPLENQRRRKTGEPAVVANIDEFKKSWSIFTEGSLSHLDWNNVIAAGGSVLASLLPLNERSKISKRAMRKHFHQAAFPASDVDLFLWGLTPEQVGDAF